MEVRGSNKVQSRSLSVPVPHKATPVPNPANVPKVPCTVLPQSCQGLTDQLPQLRLPRNPDHRLTKHRLWTQERRHEGAASPAPRRRQASRVHRARCLLHSSAVHRILVLTGLRYAPPKTSITGRDMHTTRGAIASGAQPKAASA